MALDRPDRVTRFCALDIIPTHHLLTNVTLADGASKSYHWFFMAQKAPFPEKLICADLDYYIQYKLNKKGVGLQIFTPEAFKEYARCTTPEQIHAVCEDYRATVTLDLAMDTEDFGEAPDPMPGHGALGQQQPCRRATSSRSRPGHPGPRISAAGRFRPGIIRRNIARTWSMRASGRSSRARKPDPILRKPMPTGHRAS